MIPYGRQTIDEDDIDAVVAVLRGDDITVAFKQVLVSRERVL